MSTFSGLEMSKRALFAQQGALHTTGHNISNVNTDGYSRQRVNFETTPAYPQASRTMPGGAGQKGTGVQVGVIDRIRDKFLDMQYRSENSDMGYWETRQDALSRMESLLNEPSDSGLQKTMDRFWQSLKDLSANPDNDGARSVVAQRGLAVAETFNHFSKNLHNIKGDLNAEIEDSEENINGLLNHINQLNKEIKQIETHGQLPNDLYDERDRMLDELSGYMNINVKYEESASSALDIADGIAEIEMIDENGDKVADLLKEGDIGTDITDRVEVKFSDEKYVKHMSVDDEGLSYDDFEKTGSLSALIQAYGHGDGEGDYPEVLQKLDDMAAAFATEFNDVHKDGEDADGEEGVKFFKTADDKEFSAGNIRVNEDILENGSLIAATDPDKGGQNSENAKKLAGVFDEGIVGKDNKTVGEFYSALIGQIGVDGEEAERNVENTGILQSEADRSRQSTSAVSLDEEMSNMVKFQHAYNAAARNMTTVDEMIDRIINQMGLVGR